MLKNKRFLPISGIALLLACSFACAQENKPKEPKKTTQDLPKQESELEALALQNAETQQLPTTTTPESTEKNGTISQADILRVSEAFGHFIGRNLKTPGMNFDLESIIKGMRDGYAGKPAPMTDKEYEALLTKVQEQAFKQLSETNLKAANEFMEKNAQADGVKEIVPGKLQYIVLQEGTGPVVQEHFSPQIKYTGKYLDGSVFGSSDEVGGSITLPLDHTIPGFSKGIIGMKEGEKRRLFVHPDIGYGTTGHLPPNSLLIFEVEVLKANAAESKETADKMDFSTLSDNDIDYEDDESPEEEYEEEENLEDNLSFKIKP